MDRRFPCLLTPCRSLYVRACVHAGDKEHGRDEQPAAAAAAGGGGGGG